MSRSVFAALTQAAQAVATRARASRAPAYASRSSVWAWASRSTWCSCWPCTATRFAPNSRSCAGVAARPSMRAVERLPISRWRTTESNVASTVARTAPCLTWSAPPREPRARLRASMMSDLPLPVSPVRRLSPGPNRTAASATRARSRTFSSLSIALLLRNQGPAPPQLVAQPLVEALRRAEPNDLQPLRVGSAPDHVADPHLFGPPLAVEPHLRGAPHHAEADVLTWRENNGTDRERKRTHRHEDEVLQGWLQDRSAAGQRVRRRPARGGDDGAVSVDQTDSLPTHVDLEAQDSSLARMVDDDLVETDVPHGGSDLSDERHLEHRPLLDPVRAVEVPAQACRHLVGFDLGEKPQMSMVHAEDRVAARRREPGAAQERPAPAARQQQVNPRQEVHARLGFGAPFQLERFHLARLQRAEQIVDLVLLDT